MAGIDLTANGDDPGSVDDWVSAGTSLFDNVYRTVVGLPASTVTLTKTAAQQAAAQQQTNTMMMMVVVGLVAFLLLRKH